MNSISRIAVAITTTAFFCSLAQAAEVTLTVHHFMSPKGSSQAVLIGPWAKKIEADSKGRIEVKVFPSMSMGGKPPELYRQVRDGVVDIAWTLPGYTPGVFPRSEVFELPTVHRGSAQATNQAIQENFALIADDFKDVHPILVHVHAGNALHMVSKEIQTISDVKGLKFRTPSRTGSWMLEAWGAEPVGMPLPALPQALSKGTVDGALVPFEVFPSLRLYQLTKNSYEGEDLSRFGTSVFMFAMNKGRYNSLPADLKKIIDDNSGAALAATIGESWDKIEAPGKIMQAKSKGSKVVKLNKAVKNIFDAKGQAVVDRWIAEMTILGIDGVALVKSARSSVYKFSK